MIELKKKEDCVGCKTCSLVCPRHCITMSHDSEGFIYPTIDADMCINCGKCESVCPVLNNFVIDKKVNAWYGVFNKKEDVQSASSSGAVFYELAMYTLERQGFVWGAAWADKHAVKHICIHDSRELYKLQKSKYLQSDLGDSFNVIKEQLYENHLVLFSGTPCQVKALLLFLKRNPKNLITVEVVCHGVPSPLIFQSYMIANDVKSIDFRSKEKGWYNYNIKLISKEGNVQTEKARKNPYMKGFIKNLFNRPSCTQCPAKLFKSGADFTLGDFWGIEYVVPELYDKRGVSLMGMHTVKALNIWKQVKTYFIYRSVDYKEAIKYNPSILESSDAAKNREAFFIEFRKNGILKALKSYVTESNTFSEKSTQAIFNVRNTLLQYAIIIREGLYHCIDSIYYRFHQLPHIESIESTLHYILANKCSVVRFGDEELKFMENSESLFQEKKSELGMKLKSILQNNRSTNLIICIPDTFSELNQYTSHVREYWERYMVRTRKKWYNYLNMNKVYYNAFITKCNIPYCDKTNIGYYFDLWKAIWNNRNLLIIEGEKTKLGIGNDFFYTAHSIKRIICSNISTADLCDSILHEISKFSKDCLVLITIPNATLLIVELAKSGYQTIDVGTIDIEYEWFMVHADENLSMLNRSVKEEEVDVDDRQYRTEIIGWL